MSNTHCTRCQNNNVVITSCYQARPPRRPAPCADDRLLVPGHIPHIHRVPQLQVGDQRSQAVAAGRLRVCQGTVGYYKETLTMVVIL